MNNKVWNVPQAAPIPEELLRAGYPPLLAAVLSARGLTTAVDADEFLDGPDSEPDDPLMLADITPAIGRITRAKQLGEKVAIYGDYDVDGITSSCLLAEYLQSIGIDTVLYIPDRLEEGYGLNTDAIASLYEEGVRLIITVDCGITAIEEADFASALGMDMIITDHHECQEQLPNAIAVIDPKRPDCAYPCRDLAGVGVAYKLVCAMDGTDSRVLERFGDLVAVGTIADVMPLTGENRRIIKAGLQKLRTNPRPGFAALMDEAGVDRHTITATTIGFTLAPRINAAGRLGRVKHAAELLLESNPARANCLASELCEMNRERQRLEQDIFTQAIERLENQPVGMPIILAGENWHQGVIGIVASRLSETFSAPAIIISLDGDNGKGSCRSYKNFNLFDALSICGEYLDSFGGHMLAAGLNIQKSNIEVFRKLFTDYYVEHIPTTTEGLGLDVNITDPSIITLDGIQALTRLEPCGNGNPRPLFYMEGCQITDVLSIGGGKHIRLRVSFNNHEFECVWFSHRLEDTSLAAGERIDIAFYAQINEFRHQQNIQFLIQDIRPSDCSQNCLRLLKGEDLPNLSISRSELVRGWRYFEKQGSCFEMDLHDFSLSTVHLPAEKTAITLRVFSELSLAKYTIESDTIHITLSESSEKASLDNSPFWIRYNNRMD